jgi:hypothetical protein
MDRFLNFELLKQPLMMLAISGHGVPDAVARESRPTLLETG